MFGLGPATKIYLGVEAVDMRKGFDGLYGLVRDRLGVGSTERSSVPVQQSQPDEAESAGVGWQRTVGMREAFGKRTLPLA